MDVFGIEVSPEKLNQRAKTLRLLEKCGINYTADNTKIAETYEFVANILEERESLFRRLRLWNWVIFVNGIVAGIWLSVIGFQVIKAIML